METKEGEKNFFRAPVLAAIADALPDAGYFCRPSICLQVLFFRQNDVSGALAGCVKH